MKFRLIAFNLVLVAGIGAVFWQGRVEWKQAQKTRRENLNAQVKPVMAPQPTPVAGPQPVQPIKYADVATRDLFSKDRNPNVVIEAPKIEAPKPMPPLPVVYGVMGLPSGTRAIMAEKKGAQGRPVKAGDAVGEFQIASLDTQNVTFAWNDKQITRSIDSLIDRSGVAAGPGGAQSAAAPAAAAAAPVNKVTGGVGLGPGIPIPGGKDRACIPRDTAPQGTVYGGYKLSYDADTPMGRFGCKWTPVQ